MVLLGQFDGKSGIWKEAKMVLWSDPKSFHVLLSGGVVDVSRSVIVKFG